MEPTIIDWTNVESVFVPDDLYEHIDAPKWLDLSLPVPPVDDVAFFCRPDCRHDVSKGKMMPLGERKINTQRDNGLKKRGGISTLLHSPSLRELTKSKPNSKKFQEDLENQNPNIAPVTTTGANVNAKELVKSSAEKRGIVKEEEEKPLRRLKTKLSARNLFSGGDILTQLSEFCHEIKNFAVRSEKPASNREEATVLLEQSTTKNDGSAKKSNILGLKVQTESSPKKNSGSVKKSNVLTMKVHTEEEKNVARNMVLKEVRASPPTPQRFPSPSSRKLKSAKAGSPLHKPLKSSALGEKSNDEKRRTIAATDENCIRTSVSASDTEGSSFDMFWLFKPCSYLVK